MNPKLIPILFRSWYNWRVLLETYAKITSLPANAADAPMKADLSGMTVTQLVANGDFSGGITGWSNLVMTQYDTVSATGGILTLQTLSNSPYFIGISKNIINGHKYYTRMRAKNVTGTGSISMGAMNTGEEFNDRQLLTDTGGFTADTWVVKNKVYTATKDSEFIGLVVYAISTWNVDYVMTIDLTAHGLDSITDTAVLDAMFPHYIDGTVHAGATRFTSKDEDGNIVSVSYTPPDIVLRRVPSVSDTTERNSDGTQKKVQRVTPYTLQSADITGVDVSEGYQRVLISLAITDNKAWDTTLNGLVYIPNYSQCPATSADWGNGRFYTATTGATRFIRLIHTEGTYADIAAARTALAGTVIYYQLGTPIETDLPAVPALISKSKGTVIAEPCVCDISVYGTGITVAGFVFSEISKVTKETTGEDVTADCSLNVGKYGFTCTTADAGDYLRYELLIDTSTVANPEKVYRFS